MSLSDEARLHNAALSMRDPVSRRHFMKLASLAGAAIASPALLAACGGSESTTGAATTGAQANTAAVDLETGEVAQFITSAKQDFWSSYNIGFEAGVPELGCTTKSFIHEEDPVKELSQVRTAGAQNVRMAVGTPATGGAALPALAKECERQEIFHARVWENLEWFTPPDAGDFYVLFTTHNGEAVAYDVAKTLFEMIGGEGEILRIKGAPGSIQDQREQGFQRALKEFPGIKVVGEGSGKWVREDSRKLALNLLSANPNVKAVTAQNDSEATGVLSALRERGLKDVKVSGLDGIKEVMLALSREDSNMAATHLSIPPFQAAFMASRVFDALNGVKPLTYERMMFTGSVLVTAENGKDVYDKVYGGEFPFDARKMSRALSKDDWDVQNLVKPIEPEQIWAYASDKKKPLNPAYAKAQEADELTKVTKLYADAYKTGPFTGEKIVA